MKKSLLRILSYNIHKGFAAFNAKFVLHEIRDSIRETKADILCLQEVVGDHKIHEETMSEWPTSSQFEFLSDDVWPHTSYGKNAVYASGHHGNAILSKYPILKWENIDISTNRFEQRGLLHAEIEAPGLGKNLQVLCTHFDLLERGRKKQLLQLSKRIRQSIPDSSPLILAGDFNDWKQTLSPVLKKSLQLEEAYQIASGKHLTTFPSWLPTLKVDRIYFRNMRMKEAHYLRGGIWKNLSDHLPLLVELECLE